MTESEVRQVIAQSEHFLEVNRPREAERVARDGLKQFPDSAGLHAALARSLDFQGRREDAFAAVEKAISLDPDQEWPHRLLSVLFLNGGHLPHAREAAEDALHLAPRSAQCLLCLFDVLIEMLDIDEAEKVSKELLAVAPDSAEAFYARARLAWDRPDANPQEIRKFLIKTLELDPRHAQAHFLLGTILRRAGGGRRRDATKELRSALEINPGNIYYQQEYVRAALEDARESYGSQEVNLYGQPVQFMRAGFGRTKTTRARRRFRDFSLKFVKARDVEIPFYRQKIKLRHFAAEADGVRVPFVWRGAGAESACACALEIGGRSFTVELERSDMFEDLEEDLMVISDRPAPPAFGLWILWTSAAWTQSELEESLADAGSFEVREREILFLDGGETASLRWAAESGYGALSPEEDKILASVEEILGDRARGRPLECRYSGPHLIQRVLEALSRRLPVVRFDAFAFSPNDPPALRRFGPARTSDSGDSLARQWEKQLPRSTSESSSSWHVLFGAPVMIADWLDFARLAGAEIGDDRLGKANFDILGHTLSSQFDYDVGGDFIQAYAQITGQSLRSVWRWDFNSLPLAAVVAASVNERWPCVIWVDDTGRLYDASAVRVRTRRDGNFILEGAGVEPEPPRWPDGLPRLQARLLLAEEWDVARWRDFVAAHQGQVRHFLNDGRSAAWRRGYFHLHAQVDAYEKVFNAGPGDEIGDNASALLGARPRGVLSLDSNDAAMASEFLGWVSAERKCAALVGDSYAKCEEPEVMLARWTASRPRS